MCAHVFENVTWLAVPAMARAAAIAAATSESNARSHISLMTATVVVSTPSPKPPPTLLEDNPERKGTAKTVSSEEQLPHR